MKIKLLHYSKKRGRIKCKIDNIYYDLPKGLVKKLYTHIYSGEKIDIKNTELMPDKFWETKDIK